MDNAKLQELVRELKAGPQPDEVDEAEAMALGMPDPEEMLEDGPIRNLFCTRPCRINC